MSVSTTSSATPSFAEQHQQHQARRVRLGFVDSRQVLAIRAVSLGTEELHATIARLEADKAALAARLEQALADCAELARKLVPPPKHSIRSIVAAVCDYFGVPVARLISGQRAADVARPRQIAFYLARELTHQSLMMIARKMQRDHTTVLHGARKIEALLRKDAALAQDVAALEKIIDAKIIGAAP